MIQKRNSGKKTKPPIPYEFGLTPNLLKPFDPNPTKEKRLKKLMEMPEFGLIKKVCRHYISNFILCPVENENKYWIISCFPSTDKAPVRISIWFPEVFNIHYGHHYGFANQENEDALTCMVFVHTDYFEPGMKEELISKIKGLVFQPYYRFVTGIEGQLAAFMPLTSYFDFVGDERMYEATKAHNYELTQKGRTPFKKGHNYAFVRELLR